MATLNLVGSSAKFRALLDNVDLVAPVDSTVLIQGETGTGKEVIARAIHEVSPRRRNRFVALNCAAIPSALLESELFGYEKGAFTGAANQTIGRFQVADRGTLFLDEIGDLPIELQPKLLRALQEKQFERLGGSQTLQIDVRVIAATNQDLGQMVRERRFRADLYYRLNVFPMTLPPLRERRDDIALLTEYFVGKFAGQQGKVVDTIPRDVMAALEHYDWPGNIRELQNVIERGVIMTAGSVLSRQTTELLTTEEAVLARFPAAVEATSIRRTMTIYMQGFDELQAKTVQMFPGANKFSALHATQQIQLLTAIETTPFFKTVRDHTVIGMFASPQHGGNHREAGWKLIGFENTLNFTPPFGYYDAAP